MSDVTRRIEALEEQVAALLQLLAEAKYPDRMRDGALRSQIDRVGRYTVCGQIADDFGAASLGAANVHLSNLVAPTAVNVDIDPGSDAAIAFGSVALRFTEINLSTGAFFWNANTDTVPSTKMLAARFEFGAGGASATDCTIGRDSAGVVTLGTGNTFQLKGGTSGTVGVKAAPTTTSWVMALPSAVAAGNGYVLVSTTAGVTSWANRTATHLAHGASADDIIDVLITAGLMAP